MFDSLINTLLVLAGLYVYLSLFRQAVVRQNGAASLGQRQFGVPEAVAAVVLIAWFVLNLVAASKVQHAVFQTRDLLATGTFLGLVSLGAVAMAFNGQGGDSVGLLPPPPKEIASPKTAARAAPRLQCHPPRVARP